MKTKVTVTLDEHLVPHAKRLAKNQGISLSRLVEEALRERVEPADEPSFSERWRGKFHAREGGDRLYERLAEKYL